MYYQLSIYSSLYRVCWETSRAVTVRCTTSCLYIPVYIECAERHLGQWQWDVLPAVYIFQYIECAERHLWQWQWDVLPAVYIFQSRAVTVRCTTSCLYIPVYIECVERHLGQWQWDVLPAVYILVHVFQFISGQLHSGIGIGIACCGIGIELELHLVEV